MRGLGGSFDQACLVCSTYMWGDTKGLHFCRMHPRGIARSRLVCASLHRLFLVVCIFVSVCDFCCLLPADLEPQMFALMRPTQAGKLDRIPHKRHMYGLCRLTVLFPDDLCQFLCFKQCCLERHIFLLKPGTMMMYCPLNILRRSPCLSFSFFGHHRMLAVQYVVVASLSER